MTDIRRVVTGVDDAGDAVILADETVPVRGFSNWPPGVGIAKLWGAERPRTVPARAVDFDYPTMFPSTSGYRVEIFTVMPEATHAGLPPLDPDLMVSEFDEHFPGLREHLGPDGEHATDSVDVGFIIDGEITLVLDKGVETTLRRGDFFVQNGTVHSWKNRSNNNATMAVVLLGAERA